MSVALARLRVRLACAAWRSAIPMTASRLARRLPEWAGPPMGSAGGMTSSFRHRDDLAFIVPGYLACAAPPGERSRGIQSPHIAIQCLIIAMSRIHLPGEDSTVVHE